MKNRSIRDAGKKAKNGPETLTIEKRNAYICPECMKVLLTVHIHEGITPAFVQCKEKGCKGMAISFMYRLPPALIMDQKMKPSHEWYMPGPVELGMMPQGSKDHAKNGGLFLRERTDAETFKLHIPMNQVRK